MRFAAVVRHQPTPVRAPAGEAVRRPAPSRSCNRMQSAPVPVKPAELPADLDQRVRMIGEW
jgi:hypothetical protein